MNLRSWDYRLLLGVAVVTGLFVPATAGAQNVGLGGPKAEAIAKAAEKPTPRMPDGHPDLNGFWRATMAVPDQVQVGKTTYLFGAEHGKPTDTPPPRPPVANPNIPSYKPELEAKVKDLAEHESQDDPAFACAPLGIPRVGAPHQIFQNAKELVFLYQVDIGGGDGNAFRVVPTDGRAHRTDVDPSFFGDSVGHWEGDTLVVDVTKLSTQTWLGQQGYFHSKQLHVTERITRKGDTLRYEATAEDPGVLNKPWVMDPLTELLTDNNVTEVPPCMDYDQAHLVNTEHHGGEDHPK